MPGRAFLDNCPPSIRAKLIAIIKAVADAPPPMFSGGGKWEAMHDEMGMRKPFRTTFSTKEYQHVRALGREFLRHSPRSVG